MYNMFFKRTSTYALTMLVGAVLFERVFDNAVDNFWDRRNSGKLWKHIRHEYEEEEHE